jgi:hypothetical protein
VLKQLHVDLQAFLLLALVKRSLFAQPNTDTHISYMAIASSLPQAIKNIHVLFILYKSSYFQQTLNKGPFKYYISKEVGGVRKWQFLLIYSTIYADVGG